MPVLRLAEFHIGVSVLEFTVLKNGIVATLHLTAGTCEEIYYDH